MSSPQLDHWNYTINEWGNEPFTKIISKLPNTISVLYDIGANVGGFTQVVKNKLPDIKAYCFEPVTQNYDKLIEYVPYATSFKKGIFYGKKTSKALWRGANIGAFFLEHINHGPPAVDSGEIIELEELENLNLELPDLIKMDVEGSELNIIEHSSIVKKCPYLIIEWHPEYIDPIDFFDTHLSEHKIICNLENKQFLLCLKSL